MSPRAVSSLTPLGPRQALELAVLGLARSGPHPLDAVQTGVGDIGGCCWRPAIDVVSSCVEGLAASGMLRVAFAEIVGAGPTIVTTDAGRDRLRDLLLMKIGSHSEILCHTYVLLKVAFIDHLEAALRWRELDGLIALLNNGVRALRAAPPGPALTGSYLRLARNHEIGQIESEICWLLAVRDSVMHDLVISA